MFNIGKCLPLNLVILMCMYIGNPNNINSQCLCEQFRLGIDTVHVNSVTGLQNALHIANKKNGNLTIILEKGTYELNSNLLFISTNMSNLSIISVSNSRDDVIIKGQGFTGNVTHIFNVAASHFYLANLTLGWVSQHPIQIHGESQANFAEIRNVKLVDGNEQFIKISADLSRPGECIGGIIECCHFEFSKGIAYQYYTGGIDGHRCTDWLVKNNTFDGIRSPDGNLAEHAIHFWSNSKNITVENNHIQNCDRGIGFGLSSDPSRGNVGGIILNNFVHTNRDVGIGIENSPETKIFNNTVWTDNYFNSIEYRFALTTGVEIVNNLTNQAIRSREGAIARLNNNFEKSELSYFIDPLNHNYHLSSKAFEAINKGASRMEITYDYDCEKREDSIDLGADEYFETTSVDKPLKDYWEIQYLNNQLVFPYYLKGLNVEQLTILDLQGREIVRSEISTIPDHIQLYCPPGIYFVIIKTMQKIRMIKVLIQ